jgi:hypothetical protein
VLQNANAHGWGQVFRLSYKKRQRKKQNDRKFLALRQLRQEFHAQADGRPGRAITERSENRLRNISVSRAEYQDNAATGFCAKYNRRGKRRATAGELAKNSDEMALIIKSQSPKRWC